LVSAILSYHLCQALQNPVVIVSFRMDE